MYRRLSEILQNITGREYTREQPKWDDTINKDVLFVHDRKTLHDERWENPRVWLTRAYQATGRDDSEIPGIYPEEKGSRKAQVLADLEIYEEAERIYRGLLREGNEALKPELATLLFYKALVHTDVDDLPGAIALFDKCIEIWESIEHTDPGNLLKISMSRAFIGKANALRAQGKYNSSILYYDQALDYLKEQEDQVSPYSTRELIAKVYMHKAIANEFLEDIPATIHLYDKVIAIREQLFMQEGRKEIAHDLANAYMNKANALCIFKDYPSAIELYNKAIEIWVHQIDRQGRSGLAADLALLCFNKASALINLGDDRSGLSFYEKTVEIVEKLVFEMGADDLADLLAMAYMNKAKTYTRLGEIQDALKLLEHAIEILDRLVNVEGRTELMDKIAIFYMIKAETLDRWAIIVAQSICMTCQYYCGAN